MVDAPHSFPAGLPADPAILPALLALLPLGVIYYTPVTDAAGALTDLTLAYLNPAAQRMTQLPAQPGTTYRQQFPTTDDNGAWDFHRRSWLAQEPQQFQFYYDADGFDSYFRVKAQRLGPGLLVVFTDTRDEARSQVEQALHESQRREQAARAEAERERAQLYALLTQAPVAIGLFTGDELRVSAINPRMANVLGYEPAQLLGHPLFERAPELQGQGFDDLMRQVQATQVPFIGQEVAATVQRSGELLRVYFNFVYQPLYDADGQVIGIINVAVEVTEQVQARQQVERLNQELAAANEELRLSNEEYLGANAALLTAQQQLRQLNHELEARVQARTHEAQLAQQLAEVQRQRLEHLIWQAPAAICILDGPDLVYELVNPIYQRLFPGRALLGKPLLEALPELTGLPVWHTLQQVYQTGQTHQELEMHIPVASTEGGPLEDYYFNYVQQARRDAHGTINGIIVFAFDVKEQVLARRQAEVLQAELLAAAERRGQTRQDLFQIFEQTPVAIVLLREPDHRIEYFNPAFAAVFPPENWAGGALQGHTLAEVYPRMRELGLVRLLDQVFATGESQTVLEMPLAELQLGSPRYITFAYQPYYEQGRIVGVAAFAYDATEQVVARQQVEQLNEELRARNAAMHATNAQLTRTNADLDSFVYAASHDLKSPIANIEGLLDALREYLPSGEQQPMVPRVVGMMEGAIKRFQQTLGHLTDISRVPQEATRGPEAVNLANLLEDVRQDVQPLLESTQAELVVEVNECPDLHIPAKSLRSIVFNLLSNALKYRAPDRPPCVHVRAHCTETALGLVVQDNGLGLSAAQQAKLFTMFKRLHDHGEGSGVGLYLIKRTIENAGGTITVASELGVGSTFTVFLPRT